MKRMMSCIAIAVSIVTVHCNAKGNPVDSLDFEEFVFMGMDVEQGTANALMQLADIEISRIDFACELRPDQFQRLRLAALGDVKRFNAAVSRAKNVFLLHAAEDDGNRWGRAWQLSMPFRKQLGEGLFSKKSLFQKVVANTLDDHQFAKLKHASSIANKQHTEAIVMMVVANLHAAMPMTSRQRSHLTELLLAGVEVDDSRREACIEKIYNRFGKLPRDQFEVIFDKNQMKLIDQIREMGGDFDEPAEFEVEVMADGQ